MAAIEDTIAWFREERARLEERLGRLQSGRLRIVEKHAQPPGWLEIDITAAAIGECQRYISELGEIVARDPQPSSSSEPPQTVVPPHVSAAPPQPADFRLPARDLAHPNWVNGWGVVKGQPPRWQFAGIYATHAEAKEAAAKAGEGYYARWGSFNERTKEFTSGPAFARSDSL